MPDSFLDLDLRRSNAQFALTPDGQQDSGPMQEADPQATQRFQEAMSRGKEVPAQSALPSGPFALFGAASAPVATPPPVQQPVLDVLRSMVSRLMVADGYQSQRGVRLELSDDVMPGVSLALFEEGGAMVAEFECRVEGSFIKLSEPAPALAQQLAVTLARDTVWRVIPDPSVGMVSLEMVEVRGFA